MTGSSVPCLPRGATAVGFSVDLDDTLWPIAPVIARAEAAQWALLDRRAPAFVERWSRRALAELRIAVSAAHPDRTHDLGWLRRTTLRQACALAGVEEALADAAYAAFMAERQRVDLYPGVADACARLAPHGLVSLSNGNADLQLIGLGQHFRACLNAARLGVAKPDPACFAAAAAALNIRIGDLVHIGDDPWLDVDGARAAGALAIWINPAASPWPLSSPPPLQFACFAAAVDWLHEQREADGSFARPEG